MSPLVTRILFVLLCLVVPIIWGITINALFQKFGPKRPVAQDTNSQASDLSPDDSKDEAVIEYYI